jgi:hypothetical protein
MDLCHTTCGQKAVISGLAVVARIVEATMVPRMLGKLLIGTANVSGSGAVFVGRMFEAFPVTLLVFVVAYAAAKKKRGLSNSTPRVVSLFGYTFVISGLVYAAFYDAIATGFGATADPPMQGTLDIPAQFILALLASLLVITGIGRPRQVREQGSGE